MQKLKPTPILCALLCCLAPAAMAQHLWWKAHAPGQKFTCMYGEIQVLATNPAIYYCGCTWWPGQPAGGYTGIQDPGGGRHNMIFSIWDTSPELHPTVVEADPRTAHNRFGGEGTGAHTHLDYHWELGQVYRFYVTKTQDATAANTLTRLYYRDEKTGKWVHEATISNPNNGSESVPTFGGGLNGFLENWLGKDREAPKLALYRLWLGNSPDDLMCVNHAGGDGKWGVLNDWFYLAEGDDAALAAVIDRSRIPNSPMILNEKRGDELEISYKPVPAATVRELHHLPQAPHVSQ